MNTIELNAESCWDRIKQLCKEHNVYQKNVCEELGLQDQTIRNKISRNAFPSIEELVMFANYFQVSTDYILLGKQSEQELCNTLEGKLSRIADILNEPTSSCNE